MDVDIEEWVVIRCNSAIKNNKEYLKCISDGGDSEELLDIVQRLCYQRGFADSVAIYQKCSQLV